MNELHILWDEKKNGANKRKHRISFEEARTVFDDTNAIEYDDLDHSKYEERFLLLGMSANLRILIISHCYKESDHVIRIISARKATKKEVLHYEEGHEKRI